jgi:hypothetical protein
MFTCIGKERCANIYDSPYSAFDMAKPDYKNNKFSCSKAMFACAFSSLPFFANNLHNVGCSHFMSLQELYTKEIKWLCVGAKNGALAKRDRWPQPPF